MEKYRDHHRVSHLVEARDEFWKNVYVAELQDSGGGTGIIMWFNWFIHQEYPVEAR